MATVSSPSGNSFHLWGLPDMSAPEPSASKTVTRLKNDMCQGYTSSKLLGLKSGLRTWELKLPTLAGTGIAPNVTDPDGASVSREQYVRNVVKYNQNGGTAIAYQWPPATGQYYLCDIVNTPEYKRKRGVNIYETSLTLQQRRVKNETVFNPLKMTPIAQGQQSYDWWNETSHGTTTWDNLNGGIGDFAATGQVTFSSNAQNGHNTVRVNSSLTTGRLALSQQYETDGCDVFLVCKIREDTFSTAAKVYGGASNNILKGTTSGTKFQNLSISGLQYYLNGTEYAVTDQQAPMNTFGVIYLHLPYSTGGFDSIVLSGAQLSENGAAYAKVDYAEKFVTSGLQIGEAQEYIESLCYKWGISI